MCTPISSQPCARAKHACQLAQSPTDVTTSHGCRSKITIENLTFVDEQATGVILTQRCAQFEPNLAMCACERCLFASQAFGTRSDHHERGRALRVRVSDCPERCRRTDRSGVRPLSPYLCPQVWAFKRAHNRGGICASFWLLCACSSGPPIVSRRTQRVAMTICAFRSSHVR
eukprot:7391116-Prymnesium_polylepis.1